MSFNSKVCESGQIDRQDVGGLVFVLRNDAGSIGIWNAFIPKAFPSIGYVVDQDSRHQQPTGQRSASCSDLSLH
jgi:hypothetical protein